MALSYCEICGVLIKGEGGLELPEGVICDGCYESRQVEVGTSTDDEEIDIGALIGPVQFECVYCLSLLRLPLPQSRTSVRCPQCHETFFLLPDGSTEARMQGNTTAILPKPEALRELTPNTAAVDVGAVTHNLRKKNKTQPISPVSDNQKSALRDLAAKNLDIVKSLPAREMLPVDTKRREREKTFADTSGQNLDLLPEEVGPGEADSIAFDEDREVAPLTAADEGQVDLDPERLKERATRKLKKKDLSREEQKQEKKREKVRRASERLKAKRKTSRQGDKTKSHERRELRADAAKQRGQELSKNKNRQTVKSGLLWILAALPVVATLILISMTTRGTGFASRGELGGKLRDLGHQTDHGLRQLNQHVPEQARPPQIEPRR